MKLVSAAFYTFLIFPLGAVIVLLVGIGGERFGYLGRNVRSRAFTYLALFLPGLVFTGFFLTEPGAYGNPDGSGTLVGYVLMPAAAIGNFAALMLFLRHCWPGSREC